MTFLRVTLRFCSLYVPDALSLARQRVVIDRLVNAPAVVLEPWDRRAEDYRDRCALAVATWEGHGKFAMLMLWVRPTKRVLPSAKVLPAAKRARARVLSNKSKRK